MAFGLEILLAAPLLFNVETRGCLDHKKFPTKIEYQVVNEPIQFNFHHSRKMLTRRTQEGLQIWKRRHAGNAWVASASKWHTNGLAVGGMRIETKTEMVANPYDMYGAYYCPYVKKLNVKIIHTTEIFVAREIKRGTCEFDAVMEHEFKHHDTNWAVVQTLAKRMEADTPKIVAYLERRYVPKGKVQQGFENIKQGIRDALQIYSEEMTLRKEEFNALVDTPEEYQRVSKMCDDL